MSEFLVPSVDLNSVKKDEVLTVAVPGSKSVTNRALLLAAMAEGKSLLRGCQFSEDSLNFIECIKNLGFPVNILEKKRHNNFVIGEELIENSDVEITGFGGVIPVKKAELYVGSAGTAARFLTAMLAFSDGEYVIRSSEQMKKRPMSDLINTLSEAGAEIRCLEEEGHFPMKITGTRFLKADGNSTEKDKNLNDGKMTVRSELPLRMKNNLNNLLKGSSDLIPVNSPSVMKKPNLSDNDNNAKSVQTVNEDKAFPSEMTVDITKSSQFLSALMIAAGTFGQDTVIRLSGDHGLSYADMTAEMMRSFGISVFKARAKSSFGDKVVEKISYKIRSSGRKYQAMVYDVEPDLSAAAYFYSFAALTGTKVCVKGVKRPSLQGDIQFVDVLAAMGCEVSDISGGKEESSAEEKSGPLTSACEENSVVQGKENISASQTEDNNVRAERIISGFFSEPEQIATGFCVRGPENGKLKGDITVDMSSFSDQALTLAAIAPFADAPIKITGIKHIRLQECDRINAICDNLSRLGIRTKIEEDDSIIIYPGKIHGAEIETYDDHRVAMAFSLCGLRTEGVRIKNPECTKKTFKEYFKVFDRIIEESVNK